jgi:oligopeptide transport system permease protein
MLLFPATFLSVTVLGFIMLGDAVRDALDPKLR